MGKYKAYEQYKDSGVEWLGEIPEHWDVKRFKFILKDGWEGLKIGPFGSQIKSDKLSLSGNYKVYGQENVINQDFSLGYRYLEDELFQELSVYEIQPNDLLITMMGTSGRCYIVPDHIQEGIMDSHLIRLRLSSEYSLKFIRYLIDESDYISYQFKILGKGSIMHGLNSSIIKSLELIVPPLEEQKTIAQFLDHKTSQIDALISKKEALLEKLDEKRTALISHAVTKGLDPTVPMKDSGIEWLGDIPAHWDINRLGRLAEEINDINHEMPVAVDQGIPFLSAKDLLDDGTLNFEKDIKKISEEDFIRLSKKICPKKDDIIYSRIGACLGKARIVEVDIQFLVSYSCCVIRLVQEVANPFFFKYFLDSELVLTEARLRTQGIGVPDLGLKQIAKFTISVPPLDEQKRIAKYLDKKTAEINQQKSKVQQAIDLLKEYRTALITNAVTGKIDVRQVPIPQP